jgi:hypothetical protein
VRIRDDKGNLSWSTRPTDPGDDLTDRLRDIIGETRAMYALKNGGTSGR